MTFLGDEKRIPRFFEPWTSACLLSVLSPNKWLILFWISCSGCNHGTRFDTLQDPVWHLICNIGDSMVHLSSTCWRKAIYKMSLWNLASALQLVSVFCIRWWALSMKHSYLSIISYTKNSSQIAPLHDFDFCDHKFPYTVSLALFGSTRLQKLSYIPSFDQS